MEDQNKSHGRKAVKNNRASIAHETKGSKKILTEIADAAEIKLRFSDDKNLEFGDTFESAWPEQELEVEKEAREEWEPKEQDAAEVFVFKTTCKDIAARLFETPQTVTVAGYKNANENIDNREDEMPSRLEQEIEERESEPAGERDETNMVEPSFIGSRWLRNAYSELLWSFSLLSDEQQEEFRWQFKRLRRYLALRAKENGVKLKPRDFCSNRDYILDYEEKDLFEMKFRAEEPAPIKKFSKAKPKTASEKKEVSEVTARLLAILD